MEKRLLVSLLMMTAVLFEASSAIKCYKCSYPSDVSCLNPSSSTATEECNSGFCKTQKAEIKGENNLFSAVKYAIKVKMIARTTSCTVK